MMASRATVARCKFAFAFVMAVLSSPGFCLSETLPNAGAERRQSQRALVRQYTKSQQKVRRGQESMPTHVFEQKARRQESTPTRVFGKSFQMPVTGNTVEITGDVSVLDQGPMSETIPKASAISETLPISEAQFVKPTLDQAPIVLSAPGFASSETLPKASAEGGKLQRPLVRQFIKPHKVMRRQESTPARVFGESVPNFESQGKGVEITSHASILVQGPTSQTSTFTLQDSVGQKHVKIPKQLILTGPFGSMEEVLKHRGNLRSLGAHHLHVRYFNNSECHDYLKEYEPAMLDFYVTERRGAYKGDICRTAVLANEGGFYIDLDMQLVVSLLDLVDDDTTFMTATSSSAGILNALIATVPHNLVMLNTLHAMVEWYNDGQHSDGELLGPSTMQRGLEYTLATECPENKWENMHANFKCGPNNAIRLFQETRLSNCAGWGSTVCPFTRARSTFEGSRYVLLDSIGKDPRGVRKDPMTRKDIAIKNRMFIGWPRFEGCDKWGCGLTDEPDNPDIHKQTVDNANVQPSAQLVQRADVAEERVRIVYDLLEQTQKTQASLKMMKLSTQNAEERAVLAEEALEEERKLTNAVYSNLLSESIKK